MYPGYFKIKIIKSNCQLSMQVLEMDEGLRGKLYFRYKEFEIVSSQYLALYELSKLSTLVLRGNWKEYDNDICNILFTSNAERNKYLRKLTACVNAYKKSLKNKKNNLKEYEDHIPIDSEDL